MTATGNQSRRRDWDLCRSVYRCWLLPSFGMRIVRFAVETKHGSRKQQIKGVNLLAADVAQHKRGIIQG